MRAARITGIRVAHAGRVLPSPVRSGSAALPAVAARAANHIEAPGKPRIVAIGGGTGLPAVLEGLCGLLAHQESGAPHTVTAVVTMTDDGGSSGRLREQFGVAPPGDVRNCIAAAAHVDSPFRELLQHRFTTDGDLQGHPVGNLLLTALTQITGSFPRRSSDWPR